MPRPAGCIGCRRYVHRLVEAGVDAVSLANNHANDFRSRGPGLDPRRPRRGSIAWSGPVGSAPVLERGGRRIGFIAFSTVGRPARTCGGSTMCAGGGRARRARRPGRGLGAWRARAWTRSTPARARELQGWDRGDLRAFARAAIDAGADLVFGHGPPRSARARGLRRAAHRLLAGNFVTYGGFSYEGPKGLSALLLVDLHHDGRFAGGQLMAAARCIRRPAARPDRRAISVVAGPVAADFGEAARLSILTAPSTSLTGSPPASIADIPAPAPASASVPRYSFRTTGTASQACAPRRRPPGGGPA